MSTTKQKPVSPFDLNGFLEKVGTKADRILQITFPDYAPLTFKLPFTFEEKQSYSRAMLQFIEKFKDQKRLPAAWKELGRFSEDEAAAAFAIADLSHEPKISQLDALTLMKKNASVAGFIVTQIGEASKINADVRFADEVEAEKKD